MKIVHCTSVHPWSDVRIFHKMAVSAAQAGFDVHIVALSDQAVGAFVRDGVKVHLLKQTSASRVKRATSGAHSVLRRARELEADILHIHDPELLPWAATNKGGAKLVYDAHEDLPRQVLTKQWIPNYLKQGVSAVTEIVEGALGKRVDHFIGATDTITRRFGPNATTVRNLPIADAIRPGTTPVGDRGNLFTYIGGIATVRGFNAMLAAHGLANASGEVETELHLGGRCNDAQALEIKEAASADRIFAHGFLEREQVHNLLAQSLCGLCLLLPTKNYVEALPVKLFEYMAAGIPVIASDFPLWREIVLAGRDDACGICVDPENPSAIASAMRTLCDDKGLAQRLGENGRARIEQNFDWRSERLSLFNVYRGLAVRS